MVSAAKRSGAGGSANELGSLHRSGVAAVLAAHGLAGSPLEGVSGRVPVAIALETDDAVDDIVVTMADGSRWFIQAKRTAGKKPLDAALEQWVRQDLDEGDRVVVVIRNAVGQTRLASEALRLREHDSRAILSSKQTDALAGLRSRLALVAGARTDSLLASARILSIDAEAVGQGDANMAAARLEGSVVRGQDGPAAYRALQSFFQTAAAKRVTTRAQDWVRALRDAGVAVVEDSAGAPGAIAASRASALRQYRDAVASNLDVLSLHAVCPEVPTLQIPDFLEGVEVGTEAEDGRTRTTKLTRALVRNRRFVIRGLPGVGKSEALIQSAAWLASDAAAPLPVLVRLGELAGQVATAGDLTVDALTGLALRAQGRDTPELRAALQDAVDSGHCVLLLDGLDEAYGKRGLLIDGLKRLLGECRPDLGVVLTTRASAEDVVHRLGLPVTTLQAAESSTTPIALLSELAKAKPETERAAWLEERTAAYRVQAQSHEDIWSIPLLATLATVRIARGKATATSAAALLQGVVEDSVSNWHERRRLGYVKPAPSSFDPDMLMYGFAAVGRLLNTRTGVSQGDALQAVEAALATWDLPKPALAGIAAYIVDFWDNGVGVFIEVDGVMKARSRQFAELGDAVHALMLDSEQERVAWLNASLSNPSQMNAVSLASSNLDVARWLVEAARLDADSLRRAQAASWVSEFVDGWAHDNEELSEELIEILAAAANDNVPYLAPGHDETGVSGILARAAARLDATDGHGWHFAVALARLRVPPALDSAVDAALDSLTVPNNRTALLSATRALARHNGGALTEDTVRLVEEALKFPMPAREKSKAAHDRFGTLVISGASSFSLPYGMSELALAAASHAKQLSSSAVDVLWWIGRKSSIGVMGEMGRRLRAAGFTDPEPLTFAGLDLSGFDSMAESLSAKWLLEPLAAMYPDDVHQRPNEAWRYASLARLFDSARLDNASMPDLRSITSVGPDLVTAFLDAIVTAGDINGPLAATQARQVLALDDPEDRLFVLYSAHFAEVERDASLLSAGQRTALLAVVADATPWLSFVALEMILETEDPSLAEQARAMDGRYWRNQRHLGWVRLSQSGDPESELQVMLAESSAYRAAAAFYVRGQSEPGALDTIRVLLADEDATVRGEAGGTLVQVEAASQWTCAWCGQVMKMGIYVCSNCALSSVNSIAIHQQLRDSSYLGEQGSPRED